MADDFSSRAEAIRLIDGPPEQRYDKRWTLLCCHGCHVGFTEHTLAIAFESIVLGCEGQKAVAAPERLTPWGATAVEVWKYALAQRKREGLAHA